MTFAWPGMLFSLLAVPVLIGTYLLYLQRRTPFPLEASWATAQNSSGDPPGARRHLPPLFFLLGFTFLLFGLARPEMPVNLPTMEGTVILAFDVSNSMAAEDLEPTRLDAAKAAAVAFTENQPPGVRIGIVAFSNGGLVVQRPTDGRADILATIERLSPQGGTSLGQGIFTSLNAIAGQALNIDEIADEASRQSLKLDDYSSAVIMLLTDGENTGSPDPLEIAQLAAEAGVRIYPVGIGSPEGTILEIEGYKILTQLNEPTLEEIGGLTNGRYYHAEDADSLQEIYENIDLQFKIEGDTIEITALSTALGMILFLTGGALSLFWFGRAP